jgi:crotonobetainyl-CoA:carnitine CoA-transferase CaiB-like acyl-CoA transferase
MRQPDNVSGWYMQGPYGIYPAKDGHLAISLCTLKDLGDALDVPELAVIPDSDMFPRRGDISRLTEQGTRKFTVAELVPRLESHHIWHMVVNDYEGVECDPQVRHNRHIVEVPSAASNAALKLLSHPIRYDGQTPEVRLAPQPLGAQSREILAELGFSSAEIEACIASEVVGTPEIKRERKGYELKRA